MTGEVTKIKMVMERSVVLRQLIPAARYREKWESSPTGDM